MSDNTGEVRRITTTTDDSGFWRAETLNDLRPGVHRATVQSGTMSREFILFKPAEGYLSPAMYWLLFALVAVAAILSLYDRRAVTEEGTTKSASRRHTLRGRIRNTAAAAALLLFFAGLLLVWQGGQPRFARIADGVMRATISATSRVTR